MMNWGRVALGTVLPFMFTTYDGATGASEEGSGLAVTDIEIYKSGGGLTQRSSDSGYALLDADGHALDSIVGLAGFSVDTGDDTDSGFFVAGQYYIVVVSSVTVDAQTVNFIAGTFSLGPALSVAGVEEVDVTHWLGTAAATPTVAGVPEVDLTHVAGATTNVAALATNADAIKAKTDNLPSDPADQSALEAILGAPSDLGSGASLAKNLVDIEAQTDDIGAAGAGLSAIPWNAAWDAEVQSEATDALNAYDGPTHAEMTAELATADDAVLAAIAALSIPTANAIADALLDRANGIETGYTPRQVLRLMAAVLLGKASGLDANAPVFRNLTDAKDRVSATTDADGNRSAVTLDAS